MRVAIRVLAMVFAIGYPIGVYFGLTRLGTRPGAWLLLAISVIHTAVRSRAQRRFAASSALAIPLCAGALWLDDQRYVLAMPVFINAGFFFAFFSSLRTRTPLVERFARMRVQDLTPEEIRYCRSVTKVWCAFFVVNGSIALALAALSALRLWTLYTGFLSYLLIGLLGMSEYTVRKYRFGRYGSGWHDRVLRALLPVRSTPP